MTEEWRDIQGYEGLYEVSNMGRVKSVERTAWSGLNGGCYRTVPERIMKLRKNGNGYLQVQLHQDGKIKMYLVHRLVATAFIPNPENLPEINHISEDKTDNSLENLEWCTCKENINHGTRNQRVAEKLGKPVIAIDKRTGLILEFSSAHEAERETGIANGNIIKCCKGKMNSCGGFYWMYDNDNKEAK